MIVHPAMKQTITHLKASSSSGDFIGIAAELAFCSNPDHIELFSEHLGGKVCPSSSIFFIIIIFVGYFI